MNDVLTDKIVRSRSQRNLRHWRQLTIPIVSNIFDGFADIETDRTLRNRIYKNGWEVSNEAATLTTIMIGQGTLSFKKKKCKDYFERWVSVDTHWEITLSVCVLVRIALRDSRFTQQCLFLGRLQSAGIWRLVDWLITTFQRGWLPPYLGPDGLICASDCLPLKLGNYCPPKRR